MTGTGTGEAPPQPPGAAGCGPARISSRLFCRPGAPRPLTVIVLNINLSHLPPVQADDWQASQVAHRGGLLPLGQDQMLLTRLGPFFLPGDRLVLTF